MNPADTTSGAATSSRDEIIPSKQHACSFCGRAFQRTEHLRRHVKRHSGAKYRCVCGTTFSRSDVLGRHLKTCKQGQESNVTNTSSSRRNRIRRACEECATAKARCDGDGPCRRCRRKDLICRFTHSQHADLYDVYATHEPTLGDGDIVGCSSTSETLPGDRHETSDCPIVEEAEFPCFDMDPSLDDLYTDSPKADGFGLNFTAFPADLNFDCASLDILPYMNGSPVTLGGSRQPNLPCRSQIPSSQPGASSPGPKTDTTLHIFRGFSIMQLDPLEVKCAEIKKMFTKPGSVTTTEFDSFMTRDNMIRYVQLYGSHFHPHIPILHLPTFEMIKTSNTLLLAMMIAGACYCEDYVPPPTIARLSMRLLLLVDGAAHEVEMQVPPLSTIQAGIILCSVLVTSRSEAASRFVSIQFARNISMAKRAALFDCPDMGNDQTLEKGTFDWKQWIELETRRRVASEIFCQDMAGCIFQGTSPRLSPLQFGVQLPCYEACWNASSEEECFQQLQQHPRQLRVSDAVRMLWKSDINATAIPLFECSSFGMFVLIKGLHGVLFQAVRHEVEMGDETSSSNVGLDDNSAYMQQNMQQDLFGPVLESLADHAASSRGSYTIRRVNSALQSWKITWHNRDFRDADYEDQTFVCDPLPWWWLAKLYIFLHCSSYAIRPGSEFAVPRATDTNSKCKLETQEKIMSWLARFRRGEDNHLQNAVTFLSALMKPTEED